MGTSISVSAARRDLYEIIKSVRDGARGDVVLELDGKPVAMIVPFTEPARPVRVRRAFVQLDALARQIVGQPTDR